MVCDSHGRNDQLGDPPCWLRDSRELPTSYGRRDQDKEVRCQQAPASNLRRRLVGSESLTVRDECEGIIYSLGQIIAPFGPELENGF